MTKREVMFMAIIDLDGEDLYGLGETEEDAIEAACEELSNFDDMDGAYLFEVHLCLAALTSPRELSERFGAVFPDDQDPDAEVVLPLRIHATASLRYVVDGDGWDFVHERHEPLVLH